MCVVVLSPPPQGLGGHLVEVIALLLLPVAIAMCGYAIFIFVWRSEMIAKKRVRHDTCLLSINHLQHLCSGMVRQLGCVCSVG